MDDFKRTDELSLSFLITIYSFFIFRDELTFFNIVFGTNFRRKALPRGGYDPPHLLLSSGKYESN